MCDSLHLIDPRAVKSIRGISNALLIYDDGMALSAGSADDELGIVANLQAMITFASDISMWCAHCLLLCYHTLMSPTPNPMQCWQKKTVHVLLHWKWHDKQY